MPPDVVRTQLVINCKIDLFYSIQIVSSTGIIDIVGNVGWFFGQFIGFNHKFLHENGEQARKHQHSP